MYPSGIRNYTRIVPPNRYQGSAQAGLAKALGAPNAFLLTAVDNVFDAGFSDEIRKTADAIGVPLIADREYDWTDVDPKALAAEVASAAPGAVIIVGVPDVETGEFIRTLRLALPPGTPVILPDVFAEADRLVELLGPAAQGVYVTVYGSRTATCRNAVAHSSRTSSAGVADRRDRILGPRTVPRPPRSSSTRSAGPTVRVLQSHARCSRSRSTMDPRTHPFRRERRLLESSTTVTRIDGDQFVVDRVCDRAGMPVLSALRQAQPRCSPLVDLCEERQLEVGGADSRTLRSPHGVSTGPLPSSTAPFIRARSAT